MIATPYRKDGHHPIIHRQCGQICHTILEVPSKFVKTVFVRESQVKLTVEADTEVSYQLIQQLLVGDAARNDMICRDISNSLKGNKNPLIISERREHIDILFKQVSEKNDNRAVSLFLIDGRYGKKKRNLLFEEIKTSIAAKKRICIFTTGSFIGEGFDLPLLDTLFLPLPVSFKGRIIQYEGRLRRECKGKKEIAIYDYVDSFIGVTYAMFKRREVVYKKFGYKILKEKDLLLLKQQTLF